MEAGPKDPLLVEDALQPASYRVYPETPLDEVIDLMARRGVRALPVVGESYEVLGIITSGDALDQVLRDAPGDEHQVDPSRAPMTARDVMTRAVLCVSESQSLVDAARMMVNRRVEQLPVVRDGELIGLITRDAILHALHTESRDDNDEPNET